MADSFRKFMVPASSRPSVHSTARRLGACGRTTNLLKESAISCYIAPMEAYAHYTNPRPLRQRSSYHLFLGANALAQSTARRLRGHLVRRPVLFAAALCLSR